MEIGHSLLDIGHSLMIKKNAPPASDSKLVAILDIGARAIRCDVAELRTGGGATILESLQKAVSLGKDTFGEGRIDPASIEACVEILKGFRHVLDEYGITQPEQIRAVATSSVREAQNRDAFLDRITVGAGINVEVLEDSEVEHLIYLALDDLLEHEPALRHGDVLAVEAGGGTTRVLLLRDGYVVYSGAFRLGALRMRESLGLEETPAERVCEVLDAHIHRTVNQMLELIPAGAAPVFVALAGDTETALRSLVPGWKTAETARIPLPASHLAETVVRTPTDELIRRHHLPPQEAETAGQALLTFDRIARSFGAREILMTARSMRRGLLLKMTGIPSAMARYGEQLAHSARELGRKYRFDEKHAVHVSVLSLRLFRELQPEHGLGPYEEGLLRTAALLHDIGSFVNIGSHHKHSMYLIGNSEIFGLPRRDLNIVALVARYHRRAMPQRSHPEYLALDRESRLTISKLAAILRVADALDRSHLQHVRHLQCERDGRNFEITVTDLDDVTLERAALRDKADLFEGIFGYPVVLRTAASQKGTMFHE